MSAIEGTRNPTLTHARLDAPLEPTAPVRPSVQPALADFRPALQPNPLAPLSVRASRPALAEPATGATADALATAAATVGFPQTAVNFDDLQRRLAQRRSTADAPPVIGEFFSHLYAADMADTTDAIFGWLPGLDRLAAARGPLLSVALASASVRALRGSDGDAAAGIERAFAALFGLFGMQLADARYNAFLTASATVAAAGVILTTVSVASGKSPTDPTLAATVAALASAQNPVAAPTSAPLTPKAREILADLRPILDRQTQDLATLIDALHGAMDQGLHLFDAVAAAQQPSI